MDDADRKEIYRLYVAEHLRALVGSDVRYSDLVNGAESADFDAKEVVDDVISRMGLEGD